jgi:hypothetical protein
MKKYLYLFWILFLIFPTYSSADDFFGVPVITEGKAAQKTDARLELKTGMSHDEVVAFYKEALKELPDIKFREWKNATYIEDDGKLPWHSITVSKGDNEGTTVVIMKDNWTWLIGTLTLRFIGVFIVLIILLIGMLISGNIISRLAEKVEVKKIAG